MYEELVKKAEDHRLIIRWFLDNKLREYFKFIDEVIKKHNITEKDKRPGRLLHFILILLNAKNVTFLMKGSEHQNLFFEKSSSLNLMSSFYLFRYMLGKGV